MCIKSEIHFVSDSLPGELLLHLEAQPRLAALIDRDEGGIA
jgi:hypothetical protein